jgi:hypothetical protein
MYWQRVLVREPRVCFQIAGFRFSAATLLTQRDMSGHRFKVGQAVIYLGRDKASGYRITQLMPSEGEIFNTASEISTSRTIAFTRSDRHSA